MYNKITNTLDEEGQGKYNSTQICIMCKDFLANSFLPCCQQELKNLQDRQCKNRKYLLFEGKRLYFEYISTNFCYIFLAFLGSLDPSVMSLYEDPLFLYRTLLTSESSLRSGGDEHISDFLDDLQVYPSCPEAMKWHIIAGPILVDVLAFIMPSHAL